MLDTDLTSWQLSGHAVSAGYVILHNMLLVHNVLVMLNAHGDGIPEEVHRHTSRLAVLQAHLAYASDRY